MDGGGAGLNAGSFHEGGMHSSANSSQSWPTSLGPPVEDSASAAETSGFSADATKLQDEPSSDSFMSTGVSPAIDPPAPELAYVNAELGFWPPDLALRLVDGLHTTLDLPWWAAVMGAAVVARTMLLPLSVYGMQQGARVQAMKVPLSHLEARRQAGENPTVIQTELSALYQSHGASPAGMLLPVFVQAPVFISFFWGLRRLADVRPEASSGGALWFPDLGATDPTYMLPILSTGSALALILLAMPAIANASAAEAQQQQQLRLLFGGLTLVSLPVAVSMPVSVLLFWNTNNAFSLAYALSLNHVPGLKDRIIGPIPTPSAGASPAVPVAGALGSSLPASLHAGLSLPGPAGSPAESATILQAHEATVGSLLGVAESLHKGGKREEAVAMATRAHALAEQALGREHPTTQDALRQLQALKDGQSGAK
jgi:YidC/Oxa1 family membrane protein insertase